MCVLEEGAETPRPAWMDDGDRTTSRLASPRPVFRGDRKTVGCERRPGARPFLCLYWSLKVGGRARGRGCREMCRSSASYEDLGEGIRTGAGDVAFGRVEGHVVDGLVKLLPVGSELLDARFTLQVPQTNGAVMT